MSTVIPPLPVRDGIPSPQPDRRDGGGRGPRRPRLYVLDGLRLIAALSVVGFHWAGVNLHPEVWGQKPKTLMPTVNAVASYGWTGVQLFFLISGFVICMSCWGRSPREYFVSRVIRLYPAYWFAVIATALVVNYAVTVRPSRKPLSISDVLTNLTMLQRPLWVPEVDGVYWTLWVELRFYLLFAVVAVMGLTYRRVLAFCGIWTIIAVITPYTEIGLLDLLFLPNDAPYFIAGVALYLVYRFGMNPMLLGVIGFSWLLAQNRMHNTLGAYRHEVGFDLSWKVTAGLSAVFFLVMLAAATGVFDRIQWKWLTVAGALTYPVYLLHQEMGWAMIRWGRDHGITPFPLLAMCLAAILLLSWLVHRIVERPLSAWLKRMLDSRTLSLPKLDPPVRRR
ncbi:acyltransferase family protein [Streptomyces sp. NPDC051567]|uniref:acyltransferase family protein n=1 Tax=Streptomyces sp. NPDC051567 TaxID=3365660 RepID=UPI00378E473D